MSSRRRSTEQVEAGLIDIFPWIEREKEEDSWLLHQCWETFKRELIERELSFESENIPIHFFLLKEDKLNIGENEVDILLSRIFEDVFKGYTIELNVYAYSDYIPISEIEEKVLENKHNIVILDNGLKWNSIREVGRKANDSIVINDSIFLLRMSYLLEQRRSIHETNMFWIRRDWNSEYRWKFLRHNESYISDVKLATKDFGVLGEDCNRVADKWGLSEIVSPSEKELPPNVKFNNMLIGEQVFSPYAVHSKTKSKGVYVNGVSAKINTPYFIVGSSSEIILRDMTVGDEDALIGRYMNLTLNLEQSDSAIFETIHKTLKNKEKINRKHNKENLVKRTPQLYDEMLENYILYLKHKMEKPSLTINQYVETFGKEGQSSKLSKILGSAKYIIENIINFDFKL